MKPNDVGMGPRGEPFSEEFAWHWGAIKEELAVLRAEYGDVYAEDVTGGLARDLFSARLPALHELEEQPPIQR